MIGMHQRPVDLQNTFPHHPTLFPEEEGNWGLLIVNFASGALTHPAQDYTHAQISNFPLPGGKRVG